MMYFWSAINKLQPDFLDGDRLEALFMALYPHTIDVATYSLAFIAMAWIVMVLEFALAFGLPFSRSRRY